MSTPWMNGLPWTPYEYRGTDGPDLLTPLYDLERDDARGVILAGECRAWEPGTEAGARFHRANGEPCCDACREAENQAWLIRAHARKARAA